MFNIQEQTASFLKKAVSKQYFKAKFTKYKLQFPKLRQSEIIHKITKEWQSFPLPSIKQILKMGFEINPQFEEYLKQTTQYWPNVHPWKLDSSDAAPKGFKVEQYSSEKQLPINQLNEINYKRIKKKKVLQEKDKKILIYQYIQNMIENEPNIIQTDFETRGYNLLIHNNYDANMQNLVECSRLINLHKNIDLPQQQSQQDKKVLKRINPKVRIFEKQKQTKSTKQIQIQISIDEEDQQQRKFQTFNERKQALTIQKYSKKIMIANGDADFPLQNSNEQQFSSHQIEVPKKNITKLRIKRKMKKIKKNQNLVYLTKIKRSNRHKVGYCSGCWDLKYRNHKCKPRKNVIITKKNVSPFNKWSLPVYQHLKNVYSFCLICRKFKAGHKHNQGPQNIQGFSLFPIKPFFQIGQKLHFRRVEMLFEHFSKHYQLSNTVSFYQEKNLGILPQMEINDKILLSCKYVLTTSQNLDEEIIFGPIGIDLLPEGYQNYLPWLVTYFSHQVKLNGQNYTACPLFRLNSLGFIVNQKERTSTSNTELMLGAFNNQVCLFGKTTRKILCGEEIVIK